MKMHLWNENASQNCVNFVENAYQYQERNIK